MSHQHDTVLLVKFFNSAANEDIETARSTSWRRSEWPPVGVLSHERSGLDERFVSIPPYTSLPIHNFVFIFNIANVLDEGMYEIFVEKLDGHRVKSGAMPGEFLTWHPSRLISKLPCNLLPPSSRGGDCPTLAWLEVVSLCRAR